MKSKKEIIQETIDVIQFWGRATDDVNQCVYRVENEDHPGCAIGKYILPNKYQEKFESKNASSIRNDHFGFDDLLIPEYRGHNIMFWDDLQDLHDHFEHWDILPGDNGCRLSDAGIKTLKKLMKTYHLSHHHHHNHDTKDIHYLRHGKQEVLG